MSKSELRTLGPFLFALWVFFFLGLISNAVRGEVWVVSPKGVWKAQVVSGVPSWATVVEFKATDTVLMDGDVTPDDPDPPTTVAGRAEVISKKWMRNATDATAMSTILGIFDAPDINWTKARSSMKTAIDSIARNTFPGNKFSEWLAEIELLKTGDYDRAFIQEVDKGLRKAFTVPAGKAQALAYAAFAKASADGKTEEARDWSAFLQFLLQLIQLLRDLGLFGA